MSSESSLRRFRRDAPDLRRLLAAPASCDEELMLREAIRRAVSALATLLDDAAGMEAAPLRAAMLRGTSCIAAELAADSLPRNPSDH